ncbi:MAG: hypothetical protein V3V62_14455, partial [bacterium]
MTPPADSAGASSEGAAPRPNPELFSGSLIWWVEAPTSAQYYIQAILEGYEGFGYYQTLLAHAGEDEDGAPYALARITSTESVREDMARLLAGLGEECGLRLPDAAPDIAPDHQPEAGG